MNLLRIAIRVEHGMRIHTATSKDTWHDEVIKPLRTLSGNASKMIDLLDVAGPEADAEIKSAAAKIRSGILEMSKDIHRTIGRVSDLTARGI